MATQAFIDDGYTEDGFMKEEPGIYQACSFKFRPVLPGVIRATLHHWGSIAPEVQSERINKLISEHVTEWDLKHKDKILPISVATLERLKQPFVDRMFNIITYSDSGDDKVKAVADQRDADAKN